MDNMMKEMLPYLPFALIIGAVFLLLLVGSAYTFNYFRREGQRSARR